MVYKGRKKYIVVIFAIILLLIVGVVLFLWPGLLVTKVAQVNPPLNPALQIEGNLTVTKVAALNKNDTFWGYVKNVATRQQVVTTHEQYRASSGGSKPGAITYTKVGFDYKTKAFTVAYETGQEGEVSRDKTRCYDGREYTKVGAETAWQDVTGNVTDTTDVCSLGFIAPDITDGVSPAGLTADQASSFISFLRAQNGLVNVNKLEIAENNGKKYLHYSVDITPVAVNGLYTGNSLLGAAFTKLGLDAATHPYGYRGASDAGTRLEYYVDPNTQLPVYSETTELPAKTSAGQNKPLDGYEVYRTNYTFGKATFAVQTNNEADIAIDW